MWALDKGYEYSRSGNPTRDCLEKAVAALDGAKYSLAYSSGLGALLNICHLLKTGDTVICMDDVYGGTNRYFRKVATELGLKVVFVDCTKPKCLEAAMTPQTKLVWIETPTNPTLKVIDIRACADVAHKHGDVLLAVDNSFMSAYFQRPLSLGADICMSSATKYMNGLPSHPQHELVKRQCTGCPGMVTFYIKGNLKHATAFLKNLKTFALAESLGGYESLAEHPAIMTHSSVPPEDRAALGITDTLIRLSVGLEDEEDLLADLEQALKAALEPFDEELRVFQPRAEPH
ncbi:cystathionine gamma-lyase [Willisornis vidua]|uniref:Cystathionine gamma-lyase n=1 Tax=Willisornis vidua TaxID=1566151 RepID=A0ABQ9DDB1_9PASS|nr:cystathionine gamma-lyase [Willisornis vidua]